MVTKLAAAGIGVILVASGIVAGFMGGVKVTKADEAARDAAAAVASKTANRARCLGHIEAAEKALPDMISQWKLPEGPLDFDSKLDILGTKMSQVAIKGDRFEFDGCPQEFIAAVERVRSGFSDFGTAISSHPHILREYEDDLRRRFNTDMAGVPDTEPYIWLRKVNSRMRELDDAGADLEGAARTVKKTLLRDDTISVPDERRRRRKW
jgi:hypothetical protein